jgi:hypothetical protein
MFRVLRLQVVGALASTFVAASSNPVEAGSLVENFSGYFGATTTLDGTALGGSRWCSRIPVRPTRRPRSRPQLPCPGQRP